MKNHLPPRRILLVKPSSMGDVIHALPVVAALHQHWPHAEIRWLIHPAWSELVEGHPAVSQVILFPRENFRGILGWGRSLLWARTLREWRPDLAIDLQGLLRSALMARLSGASKVVGLSDAREGASLFYSATASVNRNDHAVTRYLSVLDLLDSFQNSTSAANCCVAPVLEASSSSCHSNAQEPSIDSLAPARLTPTGLLETSSRSLSRGLPTTSIPCTSSAQASFERSLLGGPHQTPEFYLPEGKLPHGFSIQEPFIVIHPYARGEGKNLTKEQVAAFAEELGAMPLVLVGKGESMTGLPPNVIDWSGKTTLLELIGLLRRAAFIVSSDSGPMHLAVAIQPSRTLAIHRWSDPLRVGPWAKESLVWKQGEILRSAQLTDAFRASGRTPTLEEMREIARKICRKLTGMEAMEAMEEMEEMLEKEC